MDAFKEIKHGQDQRLTKCIHAREALTQCTGANSGWYHLDCQHWFWSLHHPQCVKDIPERASASASLWTLLMPSYSQLLPSVAQAQPQWLVRGLAAAGKASNKLRLQNISRRTNSEFILPTILLNYTTFFIHKNNWHPNESLFHMLKTSLFT